MRTKIFFGVAIIYLLINPLQTCTIIYSAEGDTPYGGNNEDYNDHGTYITFYPSEDDKLGWIKFSFGCGFPQGGMNESGLFWDGASAPYLDMPYSVTNKELYSGPLMQKVIEECSSCQDAQEIFDQYYCSDQFNAQYLIGDSSGVSMIVEGDDIQINNGSYQVLTNFNILHPEMGGYPCWRYDTAMNMFSENEHNALLMGSILSATSHGGNYPSLYSSIFDLTNRMIYLFFNHNFDEFIKIDLLEEISQGQAQYLIRDQFSAVNYRYPEPDAVLNNTSVEISWYGCLDSTYELQYSLDPEMEEFESIIVNGIASGDNDMIIYPLLSFFMLIGCCISLKKRYYIGLIIFIILLFLLSGCSLNKEESENLIGRHKITVSDLEAGNTYYWRVKAQRGNSDFISETTITSFSVVVE